MRFGVGPARRRLRRAIDAALDEIATARRQAALRQDAYATQRGKPPDASRIRSMFRNEIISKTSLSRRELWTRDRYARLPRNGMVSRDTGGPSDAKLRGSVTVVPAEEASGAGLTVGARARRDVAGLCRSIGEF